MNNFKETIKEIKEKLKNSNVKIIYFIPIFIVLLINIIYGFLPKAPDTVLKEPDNTEIARNNDNSNYEDEYNEEYDDEEYYDENIKDLDDGNINEETISKGSETLESIEEDLVQNETTGWKDSNFDPNTNYGLDNTNPFMSKLNALLIYAEMKGGNPKPLEVPFGMTADNIGLSLKNLNLKTEEQQVYRESFLKHQEENNWEDWRGEPNIKAWEDDDKLWEIFKPLDDLNRVGQANAMFNLSVKPEVARSSRLNINPTGWSNKELEDGVWLFNRSHLIAYRFTGHNDYIYNLMTGTTTFNQVYMAEYEDKVADAINQGATVRYQVTPLFYKDELLARGIVQSAIDISGTTDLQFTVIVPNIQKGYVLDYRNSKVKPLETKNNNKDNKVSN